MAKRIGLDGLEDAMREILQEYATDVERGTRDAVKKVADAGSKALQQTSPKKTGAYARGWTNKVTEGRLGATAVIYNRDFPGLPHLLEHGHTVMSWGRTYGHTQSIVHIAPVEEKIAEEFAEAVKVEIGG